MKSPITNVRVFFQGNVLDQAMRQWLHLDEPTPGWMRAHIDRILNETEAKVLSEGDGVIRWKNRNDRAEVREFCLGAADRLEQLLSDRGILARKYQPAVRFGSTTSGLLPRLNITALDGKPAQVLLTGEMDLLDREHAGPLRIWDLKITKDASYWRKTVAQLVFYDIVCLVLFGVSAVEVGLLQPMVEGRPYISFVPSEEDRRQMFIRIERVAQNILAGDVAPKASSDGCSYCEVRHACIKYKTEPGSHRVSLF